MGQVQPNKPRGQVQGGPNSGKRGEAGMGRDLEGVGKWGNEGWGRGSGVVGKGETRGATHPEYHSGGGGSGGIAGDPNLVGVL